MRTLTLTMSSVLLSVLMIFTSCTKNNEQLFPNAEIDTNSDLLEKIEILSEENIDDNNSRIWPLILGLAAADALGATLHYCVDDSPTTDEMIMVGGVTSMLAGAYNDPNGGSNQPHTLYYQPFKRPLSFTSNVLAFTETTKENVNNYMDYAGKQHNSVLVKITNGVSSNKLSINQFLNTDLKSNTYVINDKDYLSLASPLIKAEHPEDYQNFIQNMIMKDKFNSNGTGMPTISGTILTYYYSVLFKTKSLAQFESYSFQIEDLIVSAKGLGQKEKESLLMTMSITRYSFNFWNTVL